MDRRTLLKSTMAAATVGVAASAGLLTPGQVLAAYPKAAFAAKDAAGALSGLLGSASYKETDDIKIKAADIAENGAVVPVVISSTLPAVESITVLVDSNAAPLAASFNLNGSEPYIVTRLKMGKTGHVIAVMKSGGKLYAGKKEIKVTIGGCGG